MYLNNKGFAISTVLYSLLIMSTLILFLLVGNLSFERRTTSNFVNDIKDELNNYTTVVHNGNLTAPVLANNMIPVKYVSGNWVKADINNDTWYDYEQQMWANAITLNHNRAFDLSGNNNVGIIEGSSYLNGNVSINGKDGEYVNCGFENYNFDDTITLLIRAKINSFDSSASEFFGNWEGGGGGISYDNRTDEIYAGFKLENQDYIYVRYKVADETVLTNQYNTYAVTYDGQSIRLYFNGNEVASTSVTGKIVTVGTPIVAGGNPSLSGKLGATANLDISDMLIYDRAISSEEVKQYSENIDDISNKNELLAWYTFDDNIPVDTVINIDNIETMWVWIPRYSYTIASEDGTNYYGKQGEFLTTSPSQSLPGEIDIKFISTNIKERGSGHYKISEGISGWYTPDAFTFGNEELNGIWVGKFETSSSNPSAENGGGNTTSLDPLIKPNVTSWRGINISNAFNVALKMNDDGNRYGFSSSADTHMMKNNEWAVVSYLSQSRYGKLGNEDFTDANKEIYQNKSSDYITGCSYGAPSNANTDYGCQYQYNIPLYGTGASTTGNPYGIYDMSGGSWEYVMGNYNDVIGSSGFSSMPNSKYYNKYISNDANTACNGNICMSHGLSETAGWYGDYQAMINASSSWMSRGGSYMTNSANAGVFGFSLVNGGVGARYSFRLVATINN